MVQPEVAYQVLLVISTAVSATATLVAYRNREERGAAPLVVLLAMTTVWSLATFLGSVAEGRAVTLVFAKVVLTSVVVLVPSLLLFALEYTGRKEYINRLTLGLLAIEPAVFGALVWTNEMHGLVWRSVELDGSGTYGATLVDGLAFHVHTVYSYAVLAIAVTMIVVFALRSRYLYQRQVAAIVVATLVPWVANVVSLVQGLSYDPTPVAFTVTGIAFTWAVAREEFLDITPVATETILDSIDTAVFVTDENGRLVDINDSACELFGVSATESVGEDVRSLLSDVPEAQDIYGELASLRTATTREVSVGDRYYRVQLTPLFERDDHLVGRVFLTVDLTEQRERQEELARRNEQLDRFAGVVSHDLRNPLQVAMGNLPLARETGDDEYFDRIERSHDRMDRLIEDLLALARDDGELTPEDVELASVAESAWQYLDSGDASLSVEVDEKTCTADPERLSQLFENVFRNSVEHGGEAVTVTVRALPGDAGFAIADDGRGFDDADVESVFEDGYTTSSDGTGFGLSIVAEIADQHGWSVAATESPDRGAQIEVVTDGVARERSPVRR